MTAEGCCAAKRPDDELIVCRCEEITRGEIRAALEAGLTTVSGVKRATRAGMGLCQGQTCGRIVAGMVARETGVSSAAVEPMTARPPVRPVPMGVLANDRPVPTDSTGPSDPSGQSGGGEGE